MKFSVTFLLLLLLGLSSNLCFSQWRMLFDAQEFIISGESPSPYSFSGGGMINETQGMFTCNVWLSPSSGSHSNMYTTDNGGLTWENKLSAYGSLGVVDADKNNIYATIPGYASDGRTYVYDHSMSLNSINEAMTSASYVNDQTTYMLMRSHPNFTSLKLFSSGNTSTVSSFGHDSILPLTIHFLAEDVGFMTASNPQRDFLILKTTDGGQSFNHVFVDTVGDARNAYKKLHFIDENTCYVLKETSLLKSEDGFSTFDDIPLSVSDTLISMDFWDENIGCIVGRNGLVLETSDGGENWEIANIGESSDVSQVVYLKENLLYVRSGSRFYGKNFPQIEKTTSQYRVIPNPVGTSTRFVRVEKFNPEVGGSFTEVNWKDLRIFDLNGRMITSGTDGFMNNYGFLIIRNKEVPVDNLQNGTYILQFIDEDDKTFVRTKFQVIR